MESIERGLSRFILQLLILNRTICRKMQAAVLGCSSGPRRSRAWIYSPELDFHSNKSWSAVLLELPVPWTRVVGRSEEESITQVFHRLVKRRRAKRIKL